MDLHAAQIQGFFDIPVDHLSANPVFLEYFVENRASLGDIVVVSPDVGNVKVANMYADQLGCDLAIVDKRRSSGEDVVVHNLIGEVEDCTVLIFDDMISTAGTVCEAARLGLIQVRRHAPRRQQDRHAAPAPHGHPQACS